MNIEADEAAALEKQRYEILALASNQHANPKLLEHLFEREPEEEGIQWLTPQTDEELNEILKEFQTAAASIQEPDQKSKAPGASPEVQR